MTYERAEEICKLPIEQGRAALAAIGAEPDVDDCYHVRSGRDIFTFFKCFEDSKTLYFEV